MIKKIVILKPKKSLNFSESINFGVKESNNPKIFIANDDIIISKQTLERLVDKCDRETITGPDSNCNLGWLTEFRYKAGNIDLVPSMQLDQVKNTIEEIYNIVPPRYDFKHVEWLAFFATMIDRRCFYDVGFLDENFIYDKEDLDWCQRAANTNKKFKYCYDSFCFHFGGVSRKRKHQELGLRHDEDQKHNEDYYNSKYKKDSKPLVAFYCHDAWEYWDENSLNKPIQENKPSGIGGSETQVILLSRELSKLGYQVKIFNKCKDNHIDSGGFDVEYIPFQNFPVYSKLVTYDYLIASRYLDCFNYDFNSRFNIAMIHDVFLILGGKNPHEVHQDKINAYFCLSNTHKNFVSGYHNIPLDKIYITSNGLDLNRFNKDIKRDPFKLIYSSSPDRGLEVLLHIFPKIDSRANLHIFYGFENFGDQSYVDKIMNRIDYLNSKLGNRIHYHGRVGQDRLAEEFLSSSVWAYPSGFSETFCITALEAMAGGAIPLTSNYWGLTDTVKDGGILIDIKDSSEVLSPVYQKKWIQECNALLNDGQLQDQWRSKGKERVSRFTWEEVANQWHQFFTTREWSQIQ